MKRWLVWSCLLLLMAGARATPPPVELVDVYHGGIDLSHWWVSEKFDGVRGYWDGKHLLTRGGEVVDAPAWFTARWPATPMDGELWAGYGKFAEASAVVRSANPDDPRWRLISYRVFDLPSLPENFDSRVPAIRAQVAAIGEPWVVVVEQFHVVDDAALQAAFKRVLAKGGEGLVLHRGDTSYQAGRGVGLLKLKPFDDAEAKVLAIVPGKGRLAGKMGALLVEASDGRRFRVGGGFVDAERANPPPVGSCITYRFNGLTHKGLPRFPRFLRRRPEGPPPG